MMKSTSSWVRRLTAVVGAAAALSTLAVGLGAGTANAAVCSGTASGPLGHWGPVSKHCSYTSPASGWHGKVRVQWSTQEGTNQTACVEGRMGDARHPNAWQGLGCGQAGVGTVKWPANTLSNLEIRVKASGNSLITNVDYSI